MYLVTRDILCYFYYILLQSYFTQKSRLSRPPIQTPNSLVTFSFLIYFTDIGKYIT